MGNCGPFYQGDAIYPHRENFSLDKLDKLYVDKIVSQYETPVSIISNRDSRFTSKYLPKLQEKY